MMIDLPQDWQPSESQPLPPRRLSETPDLVEGWQIHKALLLDLMTVHGVDLIQLDAVRLAEACRLVGRYEIDEEGGVLFRKES